MAEISDLERVISNLSGFNVERALGRTTTMEQIPDVERGPVDESKSEISTPTLAPSDHEEVDDPNVVGWDGPDDPENPMVCFIDLLRMAISVILTIL
jgi:hypothetical protein